MTAAAAIAMALEAIQRQLELVRLESPELPPRQQIQLARQRCPDAILAANVALEMEQARASGRQP